MSVNHSPTAEEPGPPQDLEGQTPGNSTDRVHAFQQPSQDEKPKNPNLVRTHPASFHPTFEYFQILTDTRSPWMVPMIQPTPRIGRLTKNGVPLSSSQHSASSHPSPPLWSALLSARWPLICT